MADAHQYCTFFVDGHFFGLDVLKVQEIIRYQEMTAVPLAPPVVRGLINLRGQIVTAIDLRRRLELQRPARGPAARQRGGSHRRRRGQPARGRDRRRAGSVGEGVRAPSRDAPGDGTGADSRRLQAARTGSSSSWTSIERSTWRPSGGRRDVESIAEFIRRPLSILAT